MRERRIKIRKAKAKERRPRGVEPHLAESNHMNEVRRAAVHYTPGPFPSTNHFLNKDLSSENEFNHRQEDSYAIHKKVEQWDWDWDLGNSTIPTFQLHN
jgi:hypothetical protein